MRPETLLSPDTYLNDLGKQKNISEERKTEKVGVRYLQCLRPVFRAPTYFSFFSNGVQLGMKPLRLANRTAARWFALKEYKGVVTATNTVVVVVIRDSTSFRIP